MLDISFGELALVFIVALLVLGPEQLVRLARSAGRYWQRAQQLFSATKMELDRTIHSDEFTLHPDKDTPSSHDTAITKEKIEHVR